MKLDGPKGTAIVGDTFYVADISVIRRFDRKTGKQKDDIKIEGATLDGLVVLDHGDRLVSSWGGKAIYRGKVSGEWKEIVSGVEAPADIGFDTKRKLILVPLFTKNQV